MKHVLVTGGAGYIGSMLVPTLLNAGYRVTVVDNLMYKQNSLATSCLNVDFEFVRADVRDYGAMDTLYRSADIVIPLAALVGAPLCKFDPVGATTINKDAIYHMLDVLRQETLVVMPTTNSAYGKGDENGYCDESSPLTPLSRYAIDKVEVEKRLMDHANSVSFRLATVFGMSPRMRLDLLVNDFVYRAVHDRFIVLFEGKFRRNFIHVRDVVDAFLMALRDPNQMRGQIYNVGLSDANLTKVQLCEEIKKQKPDFYFYNEEFAEDPDKRDYLVSNSKIEKLGFKPRVTLEQGIRELIKGFNTMKRTEFSNV